MKKQLTFYILLLPWLLLNNNVSLAAPATGDKPLYLWTSTIERLVPGVLSTVSISKGATASWTLSPALATALTVDGTSGVIPVTLVHGEAGPGSLRSFTISLTSSDAAIGTFATLSLTDVDLNPAFTATYNLALTSSGDKILPAGSSITLSINNTTGGNGNRSVSITPNGSFVNLPSKTVVNVDSVQFYNAAYPAGVPISSSTLGSTVYIRAVVSDPFGSFDITSSTVTVLDPGSTPVVSDAAMTEVADSGTSTKTYEYVYTIPALGSEGVWTTNVTANEGYEVAISHTETALIGVGLPSLTVLKSASVSSDPFNGTINPKAIPGAEMLYSIQVVNTGYGSIDANTVFLDDAIPANTALKVTDLGGAGSGPVLFIDGSPVSGLTYNFIAPGDLTDDVEFSVDGADWTYAPTADVNGVDTNVKHIRVNPKSAMLGNTGSGNPGFQLQFAIIVQ